MPERLDRTNDTSRQLLGCFMFPEKLARVANDGDTLAREVRANITEAQSTWQDVTKLYHQALADRTRTPMRALLDTHKAAGERLEKIAAGVNKVTQRMHAEVEKLAAELELPADGPMAAELRAAFARLPDDTQRMHALRKLQAGGDPAAVGAILSAPPLLSGWQQVEDFTELRAAAADALFPERAARRELLAELGDVLDRAVLGLARQIRELLPPEVVDASRDDDAAGDLAERLAQIERERRQRDRERARLAYVQ